MSSSLHIAPIGSLSYLMRGKRIAFRLNRVDSLAEVRPGRFEGMANGAAFVIEGGKAAGGAANEWFLTWGDNLRDCPCSGPVDALNLIETC